MSSTPDLPGGAAPDSPVDAALGLLATLEDRPLDEHLEVYGRAHGLLQDALAGLDEG